MAKKQTAMPDEEWDKVLNIRTMGRDDSIANQYNYPYEPTPYCVLERLAQSGYIKKADVLLDYGCGKGRVDFFLAYQTKCHTVGVEYNEQILSRTLENKRNAAAGGRTAFYLANAKAFEVGDDISRLYFFNPFSVEILKGVMERILESYYIKPRDMQLFFYYPSDEYISYLMSVEQLQFEDEIDCMDLFTPEDKRERIVIFSLHDEAMD